MTEKNWNYEGNYDTCCNNSTVEKKPASGAGAKLKLGGSFGKLITVIALYLLWAGVLTLMAGASSQAFTGIIIVISVAIGWKCVTSIQPRMFLFMPLIGWGIYFLVKFFVSLFAGLFLTPWQVAKWIFLRV